MEPDEEPIIPIPPGPRVDLYHTAKGPLLIFSEMPAFKAGEQEQFEQARAELRADGYAVVSFRFPITVVDHGD